MKSIFLICSRVKIPNARVILLFGLFFYALPSIAQTVPVNDDCSNAVALTVNAAAIGGTLANASNQNIAGLNSFYSTKNDVWYSFTATCTSHIITIDYISNPGSNIYFEIYSGSCSSLTLVNSAYSTASTYTNRQVTGLSIGTTYFIRVIDHKPGATGFTISMTLDSPVLSTNTASNIANTTATLNGSSTSIPCTIVSRGFFYSESRNNSNPQSGGTSVITSIVSGSTTGTYFSNVSGLTKGIGYSYTAFSYDGTNYTYSSTGVKTFTTLNQSSIADLSSLVVSSGTLSPSFTSTTTSYTATVTNATASITVTPTRLDANATIQVQINSSAFATVTSGSASSPLPLNVGSNTINLKVTAQDGTIKIYTLTVCRAVIPSVTIFPSANPICLGTSVTFTPTPTNGGTPTYQWQKGGTNTIGATGTTYSSSGISNNDAISVIMTSNAICVSPATATSNTVTMLVNTLPIVSTPLKVDDRCQVGAGSISLSVSGGSPIYTVAGCGTTISPSPTVGQTVTLSNKTISTSGGTTTFSSLSGNITYKFTVTDANGCVAQ